MPGAAGQCSLREFSARLQTLVRLFQLRNYLLPVKYFM